MTTFFSHRFILFQIIQRRFIFQFFSSSFDLLSDHSSFKYTLLVALYLALADFFLAQFLALRTLTLWLNDRMNKCD